MKTHHTHTQNKRIKMTMTLTKKKKEKKTHHTLYSQWWVPAAGEKPQTHTGNLWEHPGPQTEFMVNYTQRYHRKGSQLLHTRQEPRQTCRHLGDAVQMGNIVAHGGQTPGGAEFRAHLAPADLGAGSSGHAEAPTPAAAEDGGRARAQGTLSRACRGCAACGPGWRGLATVLPPSRAHRPGRPRASPWPPRAEPMQAWGPSPQEGPRAPRRTPHAGAARASSGHPDRGPPRRRRSIPGCTPCPVSPPHLRPPPPARVAPAGAHVHQLPTRHPWRRPPAPPGPTPAARSLLEHGCGAAGAPGRRAGQGWLSGAG